MREPSVRTVLPWSRTVRAYLWVAALVTLYLYIFVRVQWRVGDEGDMLNGALAVAEGKVPYRDFFDLRGPGCFYWLGLFFKTFGATWLVARAHLLLTGTLISLLVYHLTRRAHPGPESILPCALVTGLSIPFWAAPHHHWDSNLFALAATASFFYWQDHRNVRWLFASGLLAGLASCFIYQKGFYLLLAFVAILVISRMQCLAPVRLSRCLCAILGGYGAVGLAALGWFHKLGAVPDLGEATIRLPLANYGDANRLPYAYHLMAYSLGDLAPVVSKFPSALSVLSSVVLLVPAALIAASPFLVIALAAMCLMAQPAGRWLQLPLIPYCVTGFALWFSEIHRRDMMHLVYGCPLLLIALLLLWVCIDRRRVARILVTAGIVIPLVALSAGRGILALSATERIVTRRGAILLPKDDPALRFLLSDEIARGDYVFVYPYYSTYYFLADVRNPTRFGEMMYGPGSRPHFEEAISAIDAKRVKYILWDTLVEGENLKEWFPAYQHPPENEQWMELYFQAHYQQQAILNGFRVLRRR